MLSISTSLTLYRLERKMQRAESYDDWKKAALEHDSLSGLEAW
jgi:hypothetical protein